MTENVANLVDTPTKRFGTGEIVVAVSGVALVALMFLPWFNWLSGISITTGGETKNVGGGLSAWGFFGAKAYLLLTAAVLAIAAGLLKRSMPSGAGTALTLVVAFLGLVVAGLTLFYVVSPPLVDVPRGGMTLLDVDSAPAIGSYLGVVAALGIGLGGVLSWRSGRA